MSRNDARCNRTFRLSFTSHSNAYATATILVGEHRLTFSKENDITNIELLLGEPIPFSWLGTYTAHDDPDMPDNIKRVINYMMSNIGHAKWHGGDGVIHDPD
jgi:hypothetical protein